MDVVTFFYKMSNLIYSGTEGVKKELELTTKVTKDKEKKIQEPTQQINSSTRNEHNISLRRKFLTQVYIIRDTK